MSRRPSSPSSTAGAAATRSRARPAPCRWEGRGPSRPTSCLRRKRVDRAGSERQSAPRTAARQRRREAAAVTNRVVWRADRHLLTGQHVPPGSPVRESIDYPANFADLPPCPILARALLLTPGKSRQDGEEYRLKHALDRRRPREPRRARAASATYASISDLPGPGHPPDRRRRGQPHRLFQLRGRGKTALREW